MKKAEQRQYNADPNFDNRTEHEKSKEYERAPGKKAWDIAKKHVGSKAYRKGVPLDQLPAGAAKCNKFVYDIQEKAGNKVPLSGGLFGGDPPSARNWETANDIEGWKIVRDPKPGDVAAYYGHVGIVSGPNRTISAASPERGDAVVENDWGFRPEQKGKVVFRRYIGKK